MKKKMFLAMLMVCSLLAKSQDKKENTPAITICGGPQIKYQSLNGLQGVFVGGGGCFKVSRKVNLTAQGVLLTNPGGMTTNNLANGVSAPKLFSGYGGIGVQVKFYEYKKLRFYTESNVFGGGYTFDKEKDINFFSISAGVKAKYPLNHFVSLVAGVSLPRYFYSGSVDYKLYQTRPMFSLSFEFGPNNF
jgi:hypothetical protein